jgi:nicotinamide mononucleotide transporter
VKEFFLAAYHTTPLYQIILEAIAFVFGIASVQLARRQNIAVYPVGLIATTITVYLLYKAGYFGDMVVNGYYSIMSLYGWYMWSRKTSGQNIAISRTTYLEKIIAAILFILTLIVIYSVYVGFGQTIEIENYLDILSSGIFFAAMYFMALKKIENWSLWIIGNLIAIPLYAYRGLGMLSIQYIIFTIIAIRAYITWKNILSRQSQEKAF